MRETPRFNKHNLPELFDAVWEQQRHLPRYNECVTHGYGGGTKAFYRVRGEWCKARKINVENENANARAANMTTVSQEEIKDQCAEVRADRAGRGPRRVQAVVTKSEKQTESEKFRDQYLAAMARIRGHA